MCGSPSRLKVRRACHLTYLVAATPDRSKLAWNAVLANLRFRVAYVRLEVFELDVKLDRDGCLERSLMAPTGGGCGRRESPRVEGPGPLCPRPRLSWSGCELVRRTRAGPVFGWDARSPVRRPIFGRYGWMDARISDEGCMGFRRLHFSDSSMLSTVVASHIFQHLARKKQRTLQWKPIKRLKGLWLYAKNDSET